jgi:DNA repair protein RadD
VQSEWLNVDDVTYQKWAKQGKPDSIRVSYHCGITSINEWLCPDHGGFAASRYHARMPALGSDAKTTQEALEQSHKWVKPSRICVKPDGKYHQIVQLDYTQVEKVEESTYETYEDIDEIPF